MAYPYTLPGCALGNNYKAFQRFYLSCLCPLRFYRWCKHLTCHQRSPLVTCGSYEPHPIPHTFPNVAVPIHLSIPCTIHLARQEWPLPHTMTGSIDNLVRGCTVLIGGCSMNWCLDLSIITNQGLQRLTGQKPRAIGISPNTIPIPSPQIPNF
jgi:hypothetical protein